MERATLFKGRVQRLTKVERGNVTRCVGYESTVKHKLGIYPGTNVTETGWRGLAREISCWASWLMPRLAEIRESLFILGAGL